MHMHTHKFMSTLVISRNKRPIQLSKNLSYGGTWLSWSASPIVIVFFDKELWGVKFKLELIK